MKECWDENEKKRPTLKGVAFILGIDRGTVDPTKIKEIKPLPSTKDEDFTVL